MAADFAGKAILLVDDDREILASMMTAMEELGVELYAASDGNQAVRLADEHNPDIVVLDMMLPKRSGFLVLEKLKKDKKKTDPPRVIMITANPGARHRVYAETLGVDKYFNKPFRMEKLMQAVRELLEQ
ncbi:MAG: response regulator transcription factor [Phycisphaerae bacterium]|nr:response regulator transcription factor [Phycisphaerae bacterium]